MSGKEYGEQDGVPCLKPSYDSTVTLCGNTATPADRQVWCGRSRKLVTCKQCKRLAWTYMEGRGRWKRSGLPKKPQE